MAVLVGIVVVVCSNINHVRHNNSGAIVVVVLGVLVQLLSFPLLRAVLVVTVPVVVILVVVDNQTITSRPPTLRIGNEIRTDR